ncbi:MAG: PAS domain S-box protein [Paludibacteraceae bacterium]
MVIPINALLDLSPLVNLVVLVFGLASTGLYTACRYGLLEEDNVPAVHGHAESPLVPLGGSAGSIALYAFVAMSFLVIFFRGWFRVAMLGLLAIDGTALLLIEVRFPELIIPFHSPEDRFLDLLTGYLVSILSGALMLWVVVGRYDRERTRLKESLDALADAERRHQALLRHSWDILSIFDEKGTLLYNSPAVTRIHGYEEFELIGSNAFDKVHPEDRPQVLEVFHQAMAHPGSAVQARFRSPQGWVLGGHGVRRDQPPGGPFDPDGGQFPGDHVQDPGRAGASRFPGCWPPSSIAPRMRCSSWMRRTSA